MFKIRYNVRVLNRKGEVVTKRRFASKDRALNWLSDRLVHRRRAKVARQRVFRLETFSNREWSEGLDLTPKGPWQKAVGALRQAFVHTSVTRQLPVSASKAQEREQMRLLYRIGVARDFNGISYSWVIFPSGRAWEGRGDFVIEAATEGFNSVSDSYCFAGNGDQFPLTPQQRAAVIALLNRKQNQGTLVKSGLNVRGHREISTQGKSCPGHKITNADIDAIQKAVN